MKISANLVTILIWAASATVWELLFEPWYQAQILAQGGVIGFGETFISYCMLGVIALTISWLVRRRLQTPDA